MTWENGKGMISKKEGKIKNIYDLIDKDRQFYILKTDVSCDYGK
jgi:hypothetical protein